MTDVPEPALGSTDWKSWADEQEQSSDDVRSMFVNVRDILGTDTSLWPAELEAAFAAYPGGTFFFPDGDYGLNRGITVGHDNSLILAPNARIYATAATSILINHENTSVTVDPNNHLTLPQGGVITGGRLDGAGLASTVLRVATFEGLHIERLRVTNGIHRGVVVNSPGAELIVHGLHIYNETTTNVSDSIGIEVTAGDNHFEDVIVIDFTTGIRDAAGGNLWVRPHVWLSQTAARWATSVAFQLDAGSRMIYPYADTYRVGWKIAAGTVTSLVHPNFWINSQFLSSTANTANPATVVAFASGTANGIDIVGGSISNYVDGSGTAATGSAQTLFMTGPISSSVNVADTLFSAFPSSPSGGLVPGAPGEHWNGQLQGKNATASATLVGSTTAGSASYSFNSCTIVRRRERTLLVYQLTGTFDSTIAGGLRIPLPSGVSATYPTAGSIGWHSGLPTLMVAQIGNGDASVSLFDGTTSPTSEIDTTTHHGQGFNITVQIEIV